MKKWMIMLVAVACLCALLLTACGSNGVIEVPTDPVDSSTDTTTVQPSNTAEGDTTTTTPSQGGDPSTDTTSPSEDDTEEVTGYAFDDYSKNY